MPSTFIYSPHSILLETEIKMFFHPQLSVTESLKEERSQCLIPHNTKPAEYVLIAEMY